MKKETVKTKKAKAAAQNISAGEILTVEELPNEEIVLVEKSKGVEVVETYGSKGEKVGDILRKKRLEMGKKVPEISKVLCIRRVYLEAIESSNYTEIPEFPYGQGFIRSYAEFLGLDGNQLVSLFKRETNVKNNRHATLEPAPDISTPNRKYLTISVAGILALYFAWFLYTSSADKPEEAAYDENIIVSSDDSSEFPIQVEDYAGVNPDVSAEGTEVSAPIPPAVETESLPELLPAAQMTGQEASATIETEQPAADTVADSEEPKEIVIPSQGIFLVARKEVWVEVRDYEKLYLSKVLFPGDTYRVPNREDMILSAGNTDGLEVYVDGTLTQVITPQKKMNIDLNAYR